MKHIVTLWFIVFSTPALATTCWTQSKNETIASSTGRDAFELAVERAQVIFVGKTESVQTTIYEQEGAEPVVLRVEAQFEVHETIKGNVSRDVVTASNDSCACKYQFKTGITYLVVANTYKGALQVFSCEYIKPVEQSRVADARRIVGVNKARQ
ncbi:hypothetical protein [Microbulbifer sp. MCCC 1A16149]|uniref:hypothetical protein n=1 Tax=Microbulbifer sp. MCCC 1A16149 TaxID=3411322 RepID=UPI003D12B1BC